MHWEEEKHDETLPTPGTVVDLAFAIQCKTLPVDHAWALYRAIAPLLPWLEDEPLAGIHPLHVAESAHGWQRPEEPDALLHLSRRTRLVLRLPDERIEEARGLEGERISVDGHEMHIGEATLHTLSRSTSLFARRVVMRKAESEDDFLRRQLDEMAALCVRPKKLLPGLSHLLRTGGGALRTCLLSVEGLSLEEAFVLQMRGVGSHRHLGCGIFVPHKPLARA